MNIPWKALENGAALGMDDEGLLWRGGPWWVERIEGHGLGTALIEMGESVDERNQRKVPSRRTAASQLTPWEAEAVRL